MKEPIPAGAPNAEGLSPCPFCGSTPITMMTPAGQQRVACGSLGCVAAYRPDGLVERLPEAHEWNRRASVPSRIEGIPLFALGDFTLKGGQASRWKIECDALSAADWEALAVMAAPVVGRFQRVEAVPGTNAEKFAAALRREVEAEVGAPLLIVDDVLTTGGSMERQRAGREAVGVVAFARGPVPSWVVPLFSWRAAAPPSGIPAVTDSGTYGELPASIRRLLPGHEWDNMTRDEQRAWLIERLAAVKEDHP